MRFLFSCLPAYGHFQPMAPLAAELQAQQHEVRFATGPDFVGRVVESGFDVTSVGLTGAESLRAAHRGESVLRRDGTVRRLWGPYTFTHLMPGPLAEARARELVPLVRDWTPDLVIHDPTDFAAPLAAELANVPHALHSWGPAFADRLLQRAGKQAAELWSSAGLAAPALGGMYDGIYLDVCPPSLRPSDATAMSRVQPIRPVPFVTASDRDEPLPEWESPRDKTVLITLGTVASQSVVTARLIVDALADEPWNLIVTVGPGGDPSSLGPPRPSVHVTTYLPLASVLPDCDAVVSHGGAGTILACLAHGVPQVIVGQHADNARNGLLCAQAGIGVVLERASLTPDGLQVAVRTVLDVDSFAQSARAGQREIAQLPAPAQVGRTLVSLIADAP
jgi:UDP:flavonoid glycosyltransferase YjiC (YdhE family)